MDETISTQTKGKLGWITWRKLGREPEGALAPSGPVQKTRWRAWKTRKRFSTFAPATAAGCSH